MMDRIFFSINISCARIVIVFIILIPSVVDALVITLEPDDYGMGVPLQNEYVRVGITDGRPYDSPVVTPLTAKKLSQFLEDYEAPTGELTFGNAPYYVPNVGVYNWSGIVFDFNQAVSQVTLMAKNLDALHGGASWVAFDDYGDVIQWGSAYGGEDRYALYKVNIPLENVWRVIVGGSDSIPRTDFDYLTFEVPDVSVPEPNPLTILLMNLAFPLLLRRIRTNSISR